MFFPCFAQNFKGHLAKPVILPPKKDLPVNEKLQYDIEWLGIPVETLTLEIDGISDIDNYPCYHIVARSTPNGFLKRIIDLEYKVDSYFDLKTHSSRRFQKIRRIKDKINETVINFRPEKNEVDYTSKGDSDLTGVVFKRENIKPTAIENKINAGTQDLISCLYYFRLLNIEEGGNYNCNIYYHQKNWKVNFAVGSPFLKDIRKKGTFAVFPVSSVSGLNEFIFGKHQFKVYFTTDSSRIPLEFDFSTAIGTIRAKIRAIPIK